MADNLKLLEEKVKTDIDPNGAPGSVLAQNHQDIELGILSKVGKYVGSPFLAKKQPTLLPSGTLSWEGNSMNTTTDFVIKTSKLNADLVDFGKTLSTLGEGDLIQFKDYNGRSVILEFQSFVAGLDGSNNDIYEITVKGFSDNINYTFQTDETSICILSIIKNVKGDELLPRGTYTTGTAGDLYDLIQSIQTAQNLSSGFTGLAYAIWSGSGLTYNVFYPSYYINNVLYPGGTTQITLDDADPDDPRRDIIAVDSTGVIKKTGTAEENPLLPSLDPTTELYITDVLILAGALVPDNVVYGAIYLDNAEYTTSKTGGTTNFDNTTDQFDGTKCIEIPNLQNNYYLDFTKASLDSISNYTELAFRIKLNNSWSNNYYYEFSFWNGSNPVSSIVQFKHGLFGFQRTVVGSYQYCVIPLSAFTFSSAPFDRFRIKIVSNIGSFIDNIILTSSGGGTSSKSKGFSTVITQNGTVNATKDEDTVEIEGIDGISTYGSGKKVQISGIALSNRIGNLENFGKWEYESYWLELNSSGIITDLDLSVYESTSLEFINSITELNSIIYNTAPTQPYSGKEFFIKNSQSTSFIIKHEVGNIATEQRYIFSLPNEEDLEVLPGKIFHFKLKYFGSNRGKLHYVGILENETLQQAKDYADSLVVGLLDDRGNYNPDTNSNLYPTTGGSGESGAILKGDLWSINGLGLGVSTTIGTKTVTDGDVIRALVDDPGNTDSNWVITENNFGYTAENIDNKVTDIEANKTNSGKYGDIPSWITWIKDFLFSNITAKTTVVDGDYFLQQDSEDSNKTKKISYSNFKTILKTYLDAFYLVPQIKITTTVNITTATVGTVTGLSQKGRNTIIDNGVNAINLTVDASDGFCSSYVKHGTGTITFVQGSGRTLIQVDGTASFNGAVGSTATITSVGTTDYLRISNV